MASPCERARSDHRLLSCNDLFPRAERARARKREAERERGVGGNGREQKEQDREKLSRVFSVIERFVLRSAGIHSHTVGLRFVRGDASVSIDNCFLAYKPSRVMIYLRIVIDGG